MPKSVKKEKIMSEEKKVQTEQDIPTSMEALKAYEKEQLTKKHKEEYFSKLPGDEAMKETVIEQLKNIYDPELPVNIYDLGLIYEVKCWTDEETKLKKCLVVMTLTSATCSMSEVIVDLVKSIPARVEYLEDLQVDLVFDPPWSQDNMSDEAKLAMGLL